MQVYIHQFANFLRLHMDSIAVGLVATLLMIYGAYINNYFKKITKSIPFVGRFALFVLLCSAGYAFISSQAVRGGPLFKDVPARPGGLAPYRHHCRGLPHPGLPRQKRERRLTLLRPPRPIRQKPKSYFTKNVKRFSDLPKNVKHLAFLSKFPKNFSDFPSFSEPRIILYFGSDENIGIHRGPHEYRRCNYLAAEPSDSPRASDFRFCL